MELPDLSHGLASLRVTAGSETQAPIRRGSVEYPHLEPLLPDEGGISLNGYEDEGEDSQNSAGSSPWILLDETHGMPGAFPSSQNENLPETQDTSGLVLSDVSGFDLGCDEYDESDGFEEELSNVFDEVSTQSQSQPQFQSQDCPISQATTDIISETQDSNTSFSGTILPDIDAIPISTFKRRLKWEYDDKSLVFNAGIPFSVKYETTRLFQGAKARGVAQDIVDHSLPSTLSEHKFEQVFEVMKAEYREYTKETLRTLPLISSKKEKFSETWDDCIQLGASIVIRKLKREQEEGVSQRGPISYEVTTRLKPLEIGDRSRKFWRQFGSHRFLTLARPRHKSKVIRERRDHKEMLDDLIFGGFELLGREWRPLYHMDASETDTDSGMESISVIMFAISGDGLKKCSIADVIKWFIDFPRNQMQLSSKIFTRIHLGFSKTFPVMQLDTDDIKEADDIFSSTSSCMTDGCGTTTRAILQKVADNKEINYRPSWIQARVGGLKGLFVIDLENKDQEWHESQTIVFRDSQNKFESREDQTHNRILEVVDFARPLRSGNMGRQYIAILRNNGVPTETLGEIAKEAIEMEVLWEMISRIDDIDFIKVWLQKDGLGRSRPQPGESLVYAGSMPIKLEEKVIQLLDAGFTPRNNSSAKAFLLDCIDRRLQKWREQQRFLVPKSVSVKCVPDFTGLLQEGEAFLQFSDWFTVSNGENIKIVEGEALLGRVPAYSECDIQKLRMCSRPEVIEAFKDLVDCIILPTTGPISIASMLSGGDYDGDTLWVCWDPRLVEPFVNKRPPTVNSAEPFFEKPNDKNRVRSILRRNQKDENATINEIIDTELRRALADNPLGECSKLHQKVSYHVGIEDKISKQLGELCCLLLDAPKQGLVLRTEKWEALKKEEQKKLKKLGTPYYLNKNLTLAGFNYWVKEKKLDHENMHPLDYIRFVIVEDLIARFKEEFAKQCPDTVVDTDITKIFNEDYDYHFDIANKKTESPQRRENSRQICEELRQLKGVRLQAIQDKWRLLYTDDDNESCTEFEKGEVTDKHKKAEIFADYEEILPLNESGNFVLEDWMRSAGTGFSKWRLLKASALFLKLTQEQLPTKATKKLAFAVAGQELCYIKAMATGRPVRVIIESSYIRMWTKLRADRNQYEVKEESDEEEEDEDEEEEEFVDAPAGRLYGIEEDCPGEASRSKF